MKRIVFLSLVIAILSIIIIAGNNSNKKDIIIFHGEKNGDVSFNHLHHTQLPNVKCTDCHHKFEQPDNYQSCRSCHGIKADIAKPVKIFHKLCLECHKKNKDNPKTPRKCKDCHSKAEF
jgi:hypothetical protein